MMLDNDMGAYYLSSNIDNELKTVIKDKWIYIKASLSEKFLIKFAFLHESELERYYSGIALCLIDDALSPDGELFKLFMNRSITDEKTMSYLVICEWHRLLQEERYTDMMDKLNKVIDEPLRKMIMDFWTDIQKTAFKENGALSAFKNAKFNDLSNYHFGLGMYLRNNILLPDSDIYLKFIKNGIRQSDDMSSAMIKIWHTALQKEK